jgi:putative AlgH/UPF0301 family transcriptional regulator
LAKIFHDHAPSQKVVAPVYFGGPVQPGLIIALVEHASSPGGHSFELMPGLYAAWEADVIDRVIESDPEHARFTTGLVGWGPGELRAEMDLEAWYALEPDAGLVMRPSDGLWEELVRRCARRRDTI